MHNVLITGSNIPLAAYLAAEALLTSAGTVHLLLQPRDSYLKETIQDQVRRLVHKRVQNNKGAFGQHAQDRVNFIVADTKDATFAPLISQSQVHRVWFLSTASTKLTEMDQSAKLAFNVVAALAGSDVRHFGYVRPLYASEQHSPPATGFSSEYLGGAEAERRQRITEHQILNQCRQLGIQCGLFCVPALIGECHGVDSRNHSGLSSFLAGLHEFKTEIEERYPDYFDYQALRFYVPEGSYLNLMPAEEAAGMLSVIEDDTDSDGQRHQIASQQNILVSELCERVGMAYGLSLLTVDDPAELNAVDLLFDERAATAVRAILMSGPEATVQENSRVIFGGFSLPGEAPVLAALDEIRRQQDGALRERNRQAAAAVASLKQMTVQRNDSKLSYFAGGSGGSPVILLNALGQGLRYWDRLLFELTKRHQVIIWEPWGTLSGQPCQLKNHVDDLEDILRNEGIEKCHLVAWCTGPKVATEFCLRRPDAVASMVFLNAAFKSTSTARELITDYEDKLEPLFRLLDSTPTVAGVVMKSLRQCAMDAEMPNPSQLDSKEMATCVLSLTNVNLLTEVVGPFQSEASTVNYARQVLDFYSCDISAQASKIDVPVLLIGAEYDKIASPEISRAFANLFPQGRYVEVRGATHYCLYDRAAFLANLMKEFFEENAQTVRALQETGSVPALQI